MQEEATQWEQIVMVVTGVLGNQVGIAWMVIGTRTGVEEALETVVHMMEVVEGHSILLEMTEEDMMSLFLIELVAKDPTFLPQIDP